MPVTDLDRYLFDLQGFLHVRSALSPDEVKAINDLIDENKPEYADGATRVGLAGIFEWGKPFRDLINHPSVFDHLKEWVSPSLRLDICYGQCSAPGDVKLDLHLGGTPYISAASYHFRNNRPHTALTVVAWALSEVPPGEGGFTCIPGSHKANYPCPENIVKLEHNPGCRIQIPVQPGDAVIFTEALTHGTLPWTFDHERRVLFYRYTPGHMVFEEVEYADELREKFDPVQRLLLEPAYVRGPVYENGKRVGQKGRAEVGGETSTSDY